MEDHALVREALFMRLSAERDIETIGQAADITEAEAAMQKEVPDVVLLDFVLGEGDPLHIIPSWNLRFRPIRVVILTAWHNGEIARTGVAGRGVRVVLQNRFLRRTARPWCARPRAAGSPSRRPCRKFLARGRIPGSATGSCRLCGLIAAGKATREIATILGISIKPPSATAKISSRSWARKPAPPMREAVLRFLAE